MIDWTTVFEEANPRPGASEAEIAQLAAVGAPLSAAELDRINRTQSNPYPRSDPLHARWRPFDPSAWRMPDRPLPPSFLSFLRWSNGGHFSNGERHFQMFGTGLRSMLLSYQVPEYMPGVLPFAFNGGGVFYLFDMREPASKDGEYPILCASAGCLDFDPYYSPKVADTFLDACRGRVNIESLRFGGDDDG